MVIVWMYRTMSLVLAALGRDTPVAAVQSTLND